MRVVGINPPPQLAFNVLSTCGRDLATLNSTILFCFPCNLVSVSDERHFDQREIRREEGQEGREGWQKFRIALCRCSDVFPSLPVLWLEHLPVVNCRKQLPELKEQKKALVYLQKGMKEKPLLKENKRDQYLRLKQWISENKFSLLPLIVTLLDTALRTSGRIPRSLQSVGNSIAPWNICKLF